MEWTWDPTKNNENLRKHGVTFEEATLVFEGPNITLEDPYRYEQRYRTIGYAGPTILIVVHTWEQTEGGRLHGRIINARRANNHERARYEQP